MSCRLWLIVTASLFASTADAGEVPTGTWIQIHLGAVGAPDSCSMGSLGLGVGQHFELPLLREDPYALALFARPGLTAKLMPCPGVFLGGTLKTGVRAGPVQIGPYAEFGPAIAFAWPSTKPHLTVGLAADLVLDRFEVGLYAGRGGGYLEQGWLEAGVSTGVRF